MNFCLPILVMSAFSLSLLAPLLFSPRLETESQQKARRLGLTASNRRIEQNPPQRKEATLYEMNTTPKNPIPRYLTKGESTDSSLDGGDVLKGVKLSLNQVMSDNEVSSNGHKLSFALNDWDEGSSAWTANIASLAASAAILLGALTARRVVKRRQELLGVFLERESNSSRIADDLAYDIAYTTSVSEAGYGSFASPWTGDLEKFDV